MHNTLPILVIDNDADRQDRLSYLLCFLGEQVQQVALQQLPNCLLKGSYPAVFIASELLKNSALLNDFAQQSFVAIGESNDPLASHPNLLSTLSDPFRYPAFNEVLQLCRSFARVNSSALKNGEAGGNKLFRSLVGSSAPVAQVRELISQIAPKEMNVLISGELGTGKEVVARNIHYLSSRSQAPFVPVNCAAIAAELLESELFGHEQGAFVGALSTYQGRMELAHGGTLFLEEIGEMPLHVQIKLRQILEQGYLVRMGGTERIQVDARIIATSHQDLTAMAHQNAFREDLYYGLNVFPIENPPLRQRQEDIPLLLNELICRLEREGKKGINFTKEALERLQHYDWPGNVRELANLVERLAIVYPNTMISAEQLPWQYQPLASRQTGVAEHAQSTTVQADESEMLNGLFSGELALETAKPAFSNALPEEGVVLKDMLAELEIDMIRQALENSGHVVARSAELLGMRRTTLVEKMRKYGLSKDL